MRRFAPVRALWQSFYSRDLYREAARRWKGIGILYLLFLLALSWLPSSARWFNGLRGFAAGDGRAIVEQLPVITIAQGEMSAEPRGRHVIPLGDPNAGEDAGVLIIDDTIDRVPLSEEGEAIVLTRREFGTVRMKSNERRIWDLTPAADMEVTPDDVRTFLDSLPYWAVPAAYVFCVVFSLLFRSIQALLFAWLGRFWARRWSAGVDYRALLRLAAVAMTPVIILRTLLWFGPWEPPGYVRWPIAILVTLFYLRMGIRAASAAPEGEQAAQPVAPS